MESYHIPKASDNEIRQESYEFSPGDLADIPCPDDVCSQAEGSSPEDDVDLPLPPGTSEDDFPIALPTKQALINVSNTFSPSFPVNKALENTSDHNLVPENLDNLTFDDDIRQRPDGKEEDLSEVVANKSNDFLDDSKYSPSKVDSDEENQDFITIKPKVLGKEQAKKRLMAFSLSKQPSASVKKQNKAATPAKNKEKPPNPNKGSNVQEQFRATISAIEEEKKKMFQNMPSYLLLEMSELAKSSHSSMSTSAQLLEKLKNESSESKNKESGKGGSNSNKSSEKGKSKRNYRSRSRSNSRNRSKKRRRSRSKRRSRSRSRSRRSPNRSQRSGSRSRRSRDKNYKTDNKALRENQATPKKKLYENWNSFKAAGMVLDLKCDEHHKRSRSPGDKADFKPIFSYLNKRSSPMTSLQAKSLDPGSSSPTLYLGKTIKYTRTKPILCWAENPSSATEFYMSKLMLLENCDETTSTLLVPIMESKSVVQAAEDALEALGSRPWYPREDYLQPEECYFNKKAEANESHHDKKSSESNFPTQTKTEALKVNKKDVSVDNEDEKKEKSGADKRISLVNDSYLSDEDDQTKEMILGDLKVKMNLDINRVKVRSKWDSDYEGDNSEKETIFRKEEKKKTITKLPIEGTTLSEKEMDDLDIPPYHDTLSELFEKRKSPPSNLPSLNVECTRADTSETTGNLVSEYEEFLKMVSVDTSDNRDNQKDKAMESKLKTEKIKSKKPSEESQKIQTPKLVFTDWDQESDHEDKSSGKKAQLASTTVSHDDFILEKKDEKSDAKLEKSKKKPPKKKIGKLKTAKKKLLKKSSKAKKKKSDDSYSEDSSSDSYDSESDSDSDDSDSSEKKKKKKKISKAKKKSKKNSSSDSDSDSDDSREKKKKSKRKKSGKVKSSSSDDSEEDVETTLLKQLEFKKQLIKKMEEIETISEKSSRKKEIRGKKKEKDSSDETDSETNLKSGKKKKTDIKVEKDKKKVKQKSKKEKLSVKSKKSKKTKSTSESESESESSVESVKKKKTKKTGKRKRDSSESSDTDERPKSKSKSKTSKRSKKSKKDSSSSDSDDSDESVKGKKKAKKRGSKVKSDEEKIEKEPKLNFKDNLLLDEPGIKSEERSAWERKNVWSQKSKKVREDDDWEAGSSVEESEHESKRESSWDEEVAPRKEAKPEELRKSGKTVNSLVPEKDFTLNNPTNMAETNHQLGSETLKTSLSNFSFNENSFCSFGQELSRDFFLAERSYSNSGNVSSGENLKTLIEPRPFQSVSKDAEIRKPTDSELYSPGYSDSELSDAETNNFESTENGTRGDVYDPLNCDSEGSVENNDIELSSIPLPRVADITLPGEPKGTDNIGVIHSSNSEASILKDLPCNETEKLDVKSFSTTSPVKSCFITSDFTPVVAARSPFSEEKITPTKRQLMSVKGQHKLISKAASVFQDESDEENVEPLKKGTLENVQSETAVSLKEKVSENNKKKLGCDSNEEKVQIKKPKKESRDRSRERSNEREERRRRSRSKEKRESSKSYSKKASSPNKKRKSKTPEPSREKREIRSDSFEIEPLKSSVDSNELADMVQPIPVLTGLETSSSEGLWSRSLASVCEFPHCTDNLIERAETFDIYPSEESKFRNKTYDKDYIDRDNTSMEKSRDTKGKKERRKSRSRSHSPRKKVRSKSPERRKSPRSRSPRKKSASPKRRDKSPFSPRRRSPRRKSPSRRYKSSRSPDKRRKSPSRSPRKRRSSPSRGSRSASPRKYRSPKHRDESPRRKDSPRDRFSPRKDRYPQPYPDGLQNRIPVIGASKEDVDMEVSPSALRSPFESSMGFSRHMPDQSVTEPEMYNSFYEGEYTDEFGGRSYPEEVVGNNLITVKNHDIEKANSPERLSLDQRIELELRVPISGSQSQSDQYQMSNQVCPPFQEINQNHFQNSYNCDNTNISSDNFYQNQNVQMSAEFNGQYFNGHQQQQQPPPSYGSFPQYPNTQPVQNSVLQVGNIVEVVPTLQHASSSLPAKSPQIMQVGNVLQVVPTQKATPPVYGAPDGAPMKTQKATAVVAPSSIIPTPNPEIVLNPLIKAIQLEREKRRKEKEKKRAEREARRKARQLRREAKLMSVNEKLKKSVQNEGLMLGQEVEDDELLDGLDVPSPPIPVEIITVSSPSALPPAGKGILITAGFMPKPPSEKKEVKFADGVCPGEGTSTSGGEEIASPPPKPKLPKEKRFKKKKTKVKKKVKVQIIRQIIQEEDDDDDDLSPPPPPPGDPPPVFFARFPFAGDAQFPVYQTQTTTTTLTAVQYPAQTFE